MHYRAISNTVSHLEVFRCEGINKAKQKDGLTSFFMFSVLEAKVFQYGFLQEHKMCETNRYWSSTERNEVAIVATKPWDGLQERHFSCIGDCIGRNFEPWDSY